MLTSTITRTQFLHTQGTFYKELTHSPAKCTLRITEVYDEADYASFVGSSERGFKDYVLPCLYKRQIGERERFKYGLTEDLQGVIYLSPIHLKKLTGSIRLSEEKTLVFFDSNDFVIKKIVYAEPLYGSYISAILYLTDAHRGG